VLGAELTGVGRYESDGAVTVLATWAADGGHGGAHPLVPGPWPLEGGDVASTIWRTGRPVVIADYRGVPGRIAAFVRDELGVESSVGSPIVVEGRLWGALFAHSTQVDRPLAREAEARLTAFTELVATAIANAESRAELGASRARIVAAADETRRRIERDLHDGIQQRLVSLGLELRLAESTESADADEARSTIGRVAGELGGVTEELREIARGIHPAILSEGGLGPALRTLARRSAIPVAFSGVGGERLPEPIEVAAYYVVSEAVANATKYASATRIDIEATAEENTLRLSISDDGVGGADPRRGSGLVGLRDRVEALGGTIDVASPVDAGTAIVVALPLERPLPASR
jgi:signal transduction histidine kinase